MQSRRPKNVVKVTQVFLHQVVALAKYLVTTVAWLFLLCKLYECSGAVTTHSSKVISPYMMYFTKLEQIHNGCNDKYTMDAHSTEIVCRGVISRSMHAGRQTNPTHICTNTKVFQSSTTLEYLSLCHQRGVFIEALSATSKCACLNCTSLPQKVLQSPHSFNWHRKDSHTIVATKQFDKTAIWLL